MSDLDAIRAAIRRLRQANIAGLIQASSERNATEVERAWSDLARSADLPRDELRAKRARVDAVAAWLYEIHDEIRTEEAARAEAEQLLAVADEAEAGR